VLSHFDAAAHLDLAANRGARIHVSRPTNAGRAPDPGRITLHRVRTLADDERTTVDGMPVTTVARTLLDLSAHLRPTAVEEAIQRATRAHRFDLTAVRRCLDRHPRQPGAPRLRRLLDELQTRDLANTRSDLERRFLALCADHGLDRPAANARVEGLEVDAFWPRRRLIVELDGYAFHASRSAFERDRERDQRLTLAGFTVLRLTHRQLAERPEAVVHRLRRLLG
jgi:very-short-patch-repair endonuclease